MYLSIIVKPPMAMVAYRWPPGEAHHIRDTEPPSQTPMRGQSESVKGYEELWQLLNLRLCAGGQGGQVHHDQCGGHHQCRC